MKYTGKSETNRYLLKSSSFAKVGYSFMFFVFIFHYLCYLKNYYAENIFRVADFTLKVSVYFEKRPLFPFAPLGAFKIYSNNFLIPSNNRCIILANPLPTRPTNFQGKIRIRRFCSASQEPTLRLVKCQRRGFS